MGMRGRTIGMRLQSAERISTATLISTAQKANGTAPSARFRSANLVQFLSRLFSVLDLRGRLDYSSR